VPPSIVVGILDGRILCQQASLSSLDAEPCKTFKKAGLPSRVETIGMRNRVPAGK
jgi:hypothetical protein